MIKSQIGSIDITTELLRGDGLGGAVAVSLSEDNPAGLPSGSYVQDLLAAGVAKLYFNTDRGDDWYIGSGGSSYAGYPSAFFIAREGVSTAALWISNNDINLDLITRMADGSNVKNLSPTGQANFFFDTDRADDWHIGSGGSLHATEPFTFYIGRFGETPAMRFGNTYIETTLPLHIGEGAGIAKVLRTTATLDFPSTAAHGDTSLTVTLTGVQPADLLLITPGDFYGVAGVAYEAANTVRVWYRNLATTTVDPPSGTFTIVAVQFV